MDWFAIRHQSKSRRQTATSSLVLLVLFSSTSLSKQIKRSQVYNSFSCFPQVAQVTYPLRVNQHRSYSTSNRRVPIMETKDKFKLATVDAVHVKGTDEKQSRDDAPIWLKQTRVRRVFTQAQIFSFSASYLNTWTGIGMGMYYAFLNGGPVAWLFNYIIVLVGVLAQAASFAELASIQPVAGAQYFWTYVRQRTRSCFLLCNYT